MTFGAFASLNNFRLILPSWFPPVNPSFFWLMMVLGFGSMVFCLWNMPEPSGGKDITKGTAWTGFVLLMGIATYLRLFDYDQAPGFLHEDQWFLTSQVLRILDFHDHPFLFDYGATEPPFNYVSAFIWTLLPGLKGLAAMRIAASLFDLGTVWVFYLLGKEVGGRRMGLILMAMGAFSKALIITSDATTRCHLTILACALTLLFLIKVFKHPVMKHFIGLGLSLAFGGYTYAPFRIWVPSVVVGLIFWILLRPDGRPKTKSGWLLALGFAAAWSYYFFYQSYPGVRPFVLTQWFILGWGKYVIWAVLIFLYARAWRRPNEEKMLRGWITGALLCALIQWPLWMAPQYTEHTDQIVAFSPKYNFTIDALLAQMWGFSRLAFCKLFFSNPLKVPLPPSEGDSYMDFYITFFATVGLAWLVVRPNWTKTAILGLFVIGLLPFIMCPGPHVFRLLAVFAPIFLTAGWGAFKIWESFLLLPWKKKRFLADVLLLFAGIWGLVASVQMINVWKAHRWPDPACSDVIASELSKDRVYIVPYPDYLGRVQQDILYDGKDVHQAGASNPIDTAPGETAKDIAIITWVWDKTVQDRLKKEYPQAKWFEKIDYWHVMILKYAVVPFGQLSKNPSFLFYVRQTPNIAWDRKFFGGLGLGRGIILREERVAGWNDSLPADLATDFHGARIQGVWKVEKAGKYRLSLSTYNPTRLFVDGRLVLEHINHSMSRETSVDLELPQGDHAVRLQMSFAHENRIPDVQVLSLNDNWKKSLEELAGPLSSGMVTTDP